MENTIKVRIEDRKIAVAAFDGATKALEKLPQEGMVFPITKIVLKDAKSPSLAVDLRYSITISDDSNFGVGLPRKKTLKIKATGIITFKRPCTATNISKSVSDALIARVKKAYQTRAKELKERAEYLEADLKDVR